MGTGSNAGSFFGGFGEALGQGLLSHEKEKRQKKQQKELLEIDLLKGKWLDENASDQERAIAGEILDKKMGGKGSIMSITGLIGGLAKSGRQAEQQVQPQGQSVLGQPPASPLGGGFEQLTRPRRVSTGTYEETRPRTVNASIGGQPVNRPRQATGDEVDNSQWTGQMPPQPPGMFPGQDQNPTFPSVTKSKPAQAPTNLITPMPQRPAAMAGLENSEAGRRKLAEFELKRQGDIFATDQNIRQVSEIAELRRKAQVGELGQMVPGFVDAGNGEAGVVYVNPVSGARTVIKLGQPLNEFTQKLQALTGVDLSPEEQKKVVFGLNPSAAEAEALQDTRDWIDSKSPDPNIAGPAQLRVEAKRASIGATRMLTAERAAGLMKPSEKKIQGDAIRDAISVFTGAYRRAFVARREQEHLQNLLQLGEQALVGLGPEAQLHAQAIPAARGDAQALAKIAAHLANQDAKNYYQQLVTLKRDEGQPLGVIHIEEIRRDAARAKAEGKDPNEVWEIYKRFVGKEIIIVGDDLEPWVEGEEETQFQQQAPSRPLRLNPTGGAQGRRPVNLGSRLMY